MTRTGAAGGSARPGAGGGVCGKNESVNNSERTVFMGSFPTMSWLALLRDPSQHDAELTRLPVQVGTLNAQRLGGVGHSPAVVLENRRDVVALEPEPGFPEVPGGHERRRGPIQLQRRQQ